MRKRTGEMLLKLYLIINANIQIEDLAKKVFLFKIFILHDEGYRLLA